jgi:hypothetical protein
MDNVLNPKPGALEGYKRNAHRAGNNITLFGGARLLSRCLWPDTTVNFFFFFKEILSG